MTGKEAYIDEMAGQLKEWSARIDRLEAEAKKAGDGVRTELNVKIDMLRQKQEHAAEWFKQLKESEEGAWEDIRSGTDKAWAGLKQAIHSAEEGFK